MGCWYSTCFMSNLPILSGDDIAIFVLAPNYPDIKDGLTCYPTERYVPVGFPIFAEYDDDVQVRNVREINEYNKRYLHEFAPVYTKTYSKEDYKHKNPNFIPYNWDDMEQFLQNIIHGQLYVDDRNGQKKQLEHVMVHTQLYLALIKNMSERIPYGANDTLENLMYAKVIKAIEWIKEENLWQKSIKTKYGVDPPGLRRFSDQIHIDSLTRWKTLDTMAQYYVDEGDGYLLDEIVRSMIWSFVMNYSRKGYHCISGGGSQSQEMELQRVIAEFVIERCQTREVELRQEAEEYDEETRAKPLEEYIYW